MSVPYNNPYREEAKILLHNILMYNIVDKESINAVVDTIIAASIKEITEALKKE